MPLRIPQERFDPENLVLGPYQRMALLMVKRAGHKIVIPSKDEVTSRGNLRDHTFADSLFKGFLAHVLLPDGSRDLTLTPLGERALREAKVIKPPKTGKARAPRGSLLEAQVAKAKSNVVRMNGKAKRARGRKAA